MRTWTYDCEGYPAFVAEGPAIHRRRGGALSGGNLTAGAAAGAAAAYLPALAAVTPAAAAAAAADQSALLSLAILTPRGARAGLTSGLVFTGSSAACNGRASAAQTLRGQLASAAAAAL
jgi:hypothetical protein